MEILQLRYFLESAKNGSFAKTAEKYTVPTASVSASVKRLEKELGCELFHRTANRILLNDNGKEFQKSLEEVFKTLDEAVNKLTNVTIDTREINMLVRAMRGKITDYIVEYKMRHPHIAFKTIFNFDDVSFENYDIIIDEKTDRYSQYDRIDLYTTRIRLQASSANPICRKKITLNQLADQHFISIGENNSIHNLFVNACKRVGFTPNIIVQSNDLECNKKFVEAGIGIGLDREYPWGAPSNNTEYLNVIDFNEEQTICSYYKKESAYGNVEHFLNFLKSKIV